ncbi:YkgJ family cysteine cluster protein [bacterium]|nr:MAG: YkgJ family cysteine cluster protein [bacterium]
MLSELLANYRHLVWKVDGLCGEIVSGFPGEVVCGKGCDSCCRHISVFWVEAVSMAKAVADLPDQQADFIRGRAHSAAADGVCPLLHQGACLLYEHRPIICRTHGLPILTGETAPRTIDFCPRNFQRLDTIPGSAVIDLDRLNEALAAVNALFMRRYFQGKHSPSERLTIADALLLKV